MSLAEKLEAVTNVVNDRFSSLSPAQLNWKPEPGKWSIAQCLEHLIVSNSTYFSTFDKLLKGEYKLPLLQRFNPFKKAMGPMMIKSLGPKPQKKFSSPKIFEPSSTDIRSSIVRDFSHHQEKMKHYMGELQRIDGGETVITSPVSSFITYTLDDGLQILAGHEERHVNQALDILKHPNFPAQ